MKGRVAKNSTPSGRCCHARQVPQTIFLYSRPRPRVRLGREPIELTQPLHRGFDPGVVENLRFVGRTLLNRWAANPARSKTSALPSRRLLGEQAQSHGVPEKCSRTNCGAALCVTQSCSQSTP